MSSGGPDWLSGTSSHFRCHFTDFISPIASNRNVHLSAIFHPILDSTRPKGRALAAFLPMQSTPRAAGCLVRTEISIRSHDP